MDIRMIVMDLDRTLLSSDKEVSARNLAAIEACRGRGIVIGVATARSLCQSRRILDVVRPDVFISSGGAVATYRGKVIYEALLSAEVTNALVARFVQAEGVGQITINTVEGFFVSDEAVLDRWSRDFCHAQYVDFAVKQHPAAEKIVPQISLDVAAAIVAEFPGVGFIPYSGENWVTFACKGATKFQGVAAAAAHLGIDIAHVAAFGDDHNDVEMLERCGVGVAMANGISSTHEAADFVTLSNDEDGVAVWIEENIL